VGLGSRFHPGLSLFDGGRLNAVGMREETLQPAASRARREGRGLELIRFAVCL
jgi:hypothetical protein